MREAAHFLQWERGDESKAQAVEFSRAQRKEQLVRPAFFRSFNARHFSGPAQLGLQRTIRAGAVGALARGNAVANSKTALPLLATGCFELISQLLGGTMTSPCSWSVAAWLVRKLGALFM